MSTPEDTLLSSQTASQSEQSQQQDPQTQIEPGLNDVPAANELTLLKDRARMMGINFSNNIGVQALRQKIEAKQNELDGPVMVEETPALNALTGEAEKTKPRSLTQVIQDEQLRLVRLRITNMDPKKKDLPGEIFTVANEYLGTVRKFVPFGAATEDGYHVPYCIYQLLKDRTFLSIRVTKGPNGRERVEHINAKEFALDVLPPLTPEELSRLASAQAAAGVFAADNAL